VQLLNLRAGKEFRMGKGSNWRVIYPEMGATQLTLNHSIHGPGHEFTQHVHDQSEDLFLILEGGASVRQGQVYTPIHAGEAAFIPVGEVHGTVNTTDAPVRLISFQSPPDMALYRGDRDKPADETPKPQPGHESGVQIIAVARGGPAFGRPGDWRCVASPRNGARHLLVHYITLAAGEGFEHEPVQAEVAYVLLTGQARVTAGDEAWDLKADDVIFLSAGDSFALTATAEQATLVSVQAQG